MKFGTHDRLVALLAEAIAASPRMPVVHLDGTLRGIALAAIDAFRVVDGADALLSPSPAERAVIEKGRQVVESDPRYRAAEQRWRRGFVRVEDVREVRYRPAHWLPDKTRDEMHAATARANGERPTRAPRYAIETWALLWDGDRSIEVGWRRVP